MFGPASKPPKLPVEAADLPILDASVIEAICAEHRRSLLRLANRLLGWRWKPEQVTHVAERWPREWLARAVAAERIRHGEPLVDAATLESLPAQPPGHGPSRPPETRPGRTPRIPPAAG